MARSGKYDPLDRFRWRIYVLGPLGVNFNRGGFTECSAPSMTITYKEYMSGGRHLNPLQLVDRAAYKPITLKRGVIADPNVNDFGLWLNQAYNFVTDPDAKHNYRRDIVIEHLTRESNVAKRYTLINCVPVTYETGSDFSALDDTGVSIESISFLYEGFEEETFPTSTIIPTGSNLGDFNPPSGTSTV